MGGIIDAFPNVIPKRFREALTKIHPAVGLQEMPPLGCFGDMGNTIRTSPRLKKT